MHPRMLAVATGCSGGTCPAVYDDDPDLSPDELVIVGTEPTLGLRARLEDRIAPVEVPVVIKRDIVARALRPHAEPVDPQNFRHSSGRSPTRRSGSRRCSSTWAPAGMTSGSRT